MKRPFSAIFAAALFETCSACAAYFRAPQGGYVVETRDANGNLVPLGKSHVQFFAEPNGLRVR